MTAKDLESVLSDLLQSKTHCNARCDPVNVVDAVIALVNSLDKLTKAINDARADP